ncbi:MULTISPECIES: Eco57I restriction-modification methylase domain-containing protein [unclassified Fibrobacter]|uniref:type IIG restriction enzyme/methyltransferase n=1 Tax=unclassified Fibrobacter TaxID=2634177 RepID=UPI000D6A9817|nr:MULTISPECIES: Eco57I restriction-modification methylase domain-containing protein [unclassified Fibrobacter]PWJ70076.1 type II restriction/modification system DNA methylase subunit YeeA [Fibrobacter sp. UWR4]PZW73424.1 type II restriction/modification system DNA methylase subunit YeeA [Fibrobacter sp. UWR1]
MSIKFISPKKSVNSAFLKLPVSVEKMEDFKLSLKNLYSKRNAAQDEEYHKGEIWNFLRKIFEPDYSVQVNRPIDLAIFNGNTASAKPAVIIEAKSPTNVAEMFSAEHPNVKSLQELVYYFMLEYVQSGNHEIKWLAITNFDEWYFFDVKDFIRYFGNKTKPIYDQFLKFKANQMSGNKTSDFYNEIAKPAIDDFLASCDINVVHFSLADACKNVIASPGSKSGINSTKQSNAACHPERSVSGVEGSKKLLPLYKFLSPETLLAKPFANDSNSLDRNFYAELLHIIGLEEVKEDKGGKKVIRRKNPANRDKASLLESAIYQLEDDFPNKEECEAMALRLCITWVNRLLFLKLVESQILMYQKGDASYRFMSTDKIANFDELNIFFFKVLGKKIEDRDEDVLKRYPNVPYLNSSLFEPTEDEKHLKIRGIPDAQMEIFNKTVLKDERGKRAKGTLPNLDYIFKFLDAYNFASDAQGGVTSTSKTLINASVLGLIFEKINGYKDGSFFTPGFITDYMARDVLERTVVQKFNEKKSWKCENLEDVSDKIEDISEANEIVDDIRVADVAVGSGHFLVSALNRLLAIKSELNILCDADGKRIKRRDLILKVDNDELSVVDDEGEPFEYKPGNEESQRYQEALFNEKRRIIENCLFGVDLNPNSVNICRLRLWIELLKNAYYTKESDYKQLQTLPNIDINIKVGDSLLSKYPVQNGHVVLDFLQKEDKADKKNGLAAKLKEYRKNVQDYKAGGTSYNKQQLRLNIAGLKSQLKEPPSIDLFGNVVKNNDIDFSNSLEWMFEFPEILDDEGRFTGFDAIIGNPPYVQLQSMGEMSDVYSKRDYSCYNKSADLYCLFVERAYSLLKKNGYFSFIMPNKWMLVDYGKELRQFMSQTSLKKILNFGDVQFFADATIYVCIFVSQKSGDKMPVLACSLNSKNYHGEFEKEVKAATFEFSAENFGASEWSIRNKLHDSVLQKMNVGTALKDMPISINYGIKTGFNDAFFIDGKTREKLIAEDPKSEELIKPLLRGRDINAWVTESDQYLINPHNGIKERNIAPINIDEYPAIKKHLDQFIDKLVKRGDKGATPYNLRNCAYLEEFAKPKIMYPNMTSVFPFTYDEFGSLSNDKSFIITEKDNSQNLPKGTEDVIASEAKQSNAECHPGAEGDRAHLLKALLAIFNSNLVKLWIWYNCPELMGGTREIRKVYFENFRIPLDNAELLQQLATLADQIIAAKKQASCHPERTLEPKAIGEVEGSSEVSDEAIQRNIATLETQVNTLVYQLYGITDAEEIEAVEKR